MNDKVLRGEGRVAVRGKGRHAGNEAASGRGSGRGWGLPMCVQPGEQLERALGVGAGFLGDQEDMQALAMKTEQAGQLGFFAALLEGLFDGGSEFVPERGIGSGPERGALAGPTAGLMDFFGGRGGDAGGGDQAVGQRRDLVQTTGVRGAHALHLDTDLRVCHLLIDAGLVFRSR